MIFKFRRQRFQLNFDPSSRVNSSEKSVLKYWFRELNKKGQPKGWRTNMPDLTLLKDFYRGRCKDCVNLVFCNKVRATNSGTSLGDEMISASNTFTFKRALALHVINFGYDSCECKRENEIIKKVHPDINNEYFKKEVENGNIIQTEDGTYIINTKWS